MIKRRFIPVIFLAVVVLVVTQVAYRMIEGDHQDQPPPALQSTGQAIDPAGETAAARNRAKPPQSQPVAVDEASSPGTYTLPPESSGTSPPPVGVPSGMASPDYPPYLGAVASKWFPDRANNGCKSPSALLTEMAEEPRDGLWAPRMERELRGLLETHPLGFAVSVGCRATICQVTAIGPHADALEHEAESQRFWGLFQQRLRASPTAGEFATYRYFAGTEPMGDLQVIAGIVLTSVGQASPDEPGDCAPFAPAEEPAPGIP